MKLFLIVAAACCVACNAFAELPQNVPDAARYEIERRGSLVEQTGTVRSGLIAAAFATPADDSDKWYITLIVKGGDEDSQIMKTVCSQSPEMRAWIDAENSQQSTTVYHVRDIGDETQRDWIAGLKPAIEKYGLPLLVLQPPRSGKFGKNNQIVKLIHGTCSGKQLSDRLRDAVISYVNLLESASRGIAADRPYTEKTPDPVPVPVAGPPPYNLPPPQVDPSRVKPPGRLPVEWPPSKPDALTIDQIREAVPDADAAFILETIASKEASLEIVKLRWLVNRQKTEPRAEKIPPAVRTRPEPDEPESEGHHKQAFFPNPTESVTIIAGLILIFWIGAAVRKWATALGERFGAAMNVLNGTAPPNSTPTRQYTDASNGKNDVPNEATR